MNQDDVDARARQELAPTGQIRFALNHGNVVLVRRGPTDDTPSGISVDLARELARRLGVEPAFVHYSKAGAVTDSAGLDVWDVCFLAIDPLRAQQIAFTEPYVAIEGNFLVPATSAAQRTADVGAMALTVGVTRGSAYALHLSRESNGARIIEFQTSQEAAGAILSGAVQALAGVRQAMEQFVVRHADFRLLPEPFMSIRQGMGTKSGRTAAAAYLRRFVEDAKSSGFVARSLTRHGHGDLTVPDP